MAESRTLLGTAAIHRTRPILLTASAVTLGMIPIAPTPECLHGYRRVGDSDGADPDLPACSVYRLVPDCRTCW